MSGSETGASDMEAVNHASLIGLSAPVSLRDLSRILDFP